MIIILYVFDSSFIQKKVASFSIRGDSLVIGLFLNTLTLFGHHDSTIFCGGVPDILGIHNFLCACNN